jgi:two-component system, probable response regulator PhcQ
MEKVLLVDDEPLILKALVRLLQRTPCLCEGRLFKLELVTFTDPHAALEYVKNHQVSLVISDYRMPGMDGVGLLTAVKTLQPEAVRLIISGYADLGALINAINQAHIYAFLAKPWNDYELISTVGQSLRHRQLLLENQWLADQERVARGALSVNDILVKQLEQEEPGITKVNWAVDGSVMLDDEE